MTISSHQIHSVIRTYGKQLRRGLKLNRMKQLESGQAVDKINISSEARRIQVVERVASEILLGMTDPGEEMTETQQDVYNQLVEEYGEPLSLSFDQERRRFDFAVLNLETAETKALDDDESERLNERLVEITKKMVDRTMVKG